MMGQMFWNAERRERLRPISALQRRDRRSPSGSCTRLTLGGTKAPSHRSISCGELIRDATRSALGGIGHGEHPPLAAGRSRMLSPPWTLSREARHSVPPLPQRPLSVARTMRPCGRMAPSERQGRCPRRFRPAPQCSKPLGHCYLTTTRSRSSAGRCCEPASFDFRKWSGMLPAHRFSAGTSP